MVFFCSTELKQPIKDETQLSAVWNLDDQSLFDDLPIQGVIGIWTSEKSSVAGGGSGGGQEA